MKPVILLVDDEKTVLDSLVTQLKGEFGFQFRYEMASDAEEALELLEELQEEKAEVVLLISDWLMPRIKGDELLIRVAEKYPTVAQIMLSGYADEDSVQRAQQFSNLRAYVRKPWDDNELLNLIKTIFTEKKVI